MRRSDWQKIRMSLCSSPADCRLFAGLPSFVPVVLFLVFLSGLFSCSPRSEGQAVDRLNDAAYAYHYRNLDSAEHYARRALALDAANAEALNNLAFVSIIRMDYGLAQRQLDSVPALTDNQLELLVAYVQQMRLCQRQSRNRDFYDYREHAANALKRINEERGLLNDRQLARLLYAESELYIVTSIYYYYVGLEQKSIEALALVPDHVKQDTAQWLNYLYNIGAGGILTEGTQEAIVQQEFEHLIRCLQIARQHDYPFFVANALEALSEHLLEADERKQLIAGNTAAFKLLNPEDVGDEQLPAWLADNALAMFREYGDVYQIAGAYRTLASCYRAVGDYESALLNLQQALSDTTIMQAPDLVASIREQLSVAYAAVNDKQQSDLNRNLYIDLQEQTRQDRQLEARAGQLSRSVAQLNWIIAAVVAAILLLLFAVWLFSYLNQRQKRRQHTELDDLLEQRQEELAVSRLHLEKAECTNLEQRAKISLALSITPLIDRILHETQRLQDSPESRLAYIRELTGQINQDNEVLTHWIQLRQGQLSLHIESFPLQPLFDLVAKGRMSFQMKGISLQVSPTDAVVKADRILTLFMLNTLADNARKFTPQGGEVRITAAVADSYVEIAVSDTGIGISEDQLAHIFDHTVVAGHGFGLLNCRGIIEKYRKMSQIFSVCTLQAESRKGSGSRFFFRLPRGVARSLVVVGCWLLGMGCRAGAYQPLDRAHIYADSAYFSNINGNYEQTLRFADSCRQCLNDYYRQLRPGGNVLLVGQGSMAQTPPEVQWLHDSIPVNYNVILDIRNESAVAALALHQWQLYQYNNRIYTLLFKELSADSTLDSYCRTMQQTRTNRTIAVMLLIVLAMAILPAYYLLYYRNQLLRRFLREQSQQTNLETLADELRRTELELQNLHVSNAVLDNCLSTLKHETMYYPSRISQLAAQGDIQSLGEVTAYYREIYGLLCMQAMRQTERIKLHLSRLPHNILGDTVLVDYLFKILKAQSGCKTLEINYIRQDDKYVVCEVSMPNLHLSDEQTRQLFSPANDNIPYLLCRQIVRDHGDATNRRACSIRAEKRNGTTIIIVTLPAYGKL